MSEKLSADVVATLASGQWAPLYDINGEPVSQDTVIALAREVQQARPRLEQLERENQQLRRELASSMQGRGSSLRLPQPIKLLIAKANAQGLPTTKLVTTRKGRC